MDNPYQPPITPLVPTGDGEAVERSVVITSKKGPVRLEKKGSVIVITFNGIEKTIPSKEYYSSVILYFWGKKYVYFKPVRLIARVSEKDFLALVRFQGIKKYLSDDLRDFRGLCALLSLTFLSFCTALFIDKTSMSFFDLIAVVSVAIAPPLLFAVTFVPRPLLLPHLLTSFLMLVYLALIPALCYFDGDWWPSFCALLPLAILSGSLRKYFYFRSLI